jgi:hypothetical protein
LNQAILAIDDIRVLNEYLKTDSWVFRQNTLPGTLIALEGKRRKVVGNQEVPNDIVDYAGLHVCYGERDARILNERAEKAIAKRREKILQLSVAN